MTLRGSLSAGSDQKFETEPNIAGFLTKSDQQKQQIRFVKIQGCTRQDATHEVL